MFGLAGLGAIFSAASLMIPLCTGSNNILNHDCKTKFLLFGSTSLLAHTTFECHLRAHRVALTQQNGHAARKYIWQTNVGNHEGPI